MSLPAKPRSLDDNLSHHCCAKTPIQPLLLWVVHIPPACKGTNAWLLLESTAMLCEFELVVTFCSQVLVLASMTPMTGPLGMSLAAT